MLLRSAEIKPLFNRFVLLKNTQSSLWTRSGNGHVSESSLRSGHKPLSVESPIAILSSTLSDLQKDALQYFTLSAKEVCFNRYRVILDDGFAIRKKHGHDFDSWSLNVLP